MYEACMAPPILMIWHFECSDGIEMHDETIFDFYTGL